MNKNKNEKNLKRLISKFEEALEDSGMEAGATTPDVAPETDDLLDNAPEAGVIDRVINSLDPETAAAIEKSVIAPETDEDSFESINPGDLEVSESKTKINVGTVFAESTNKMAAQRFDETTKNDAINKWVYDHGGFGTPESQDFNAFWDWAEQTYGLQRPSTEGGQLRAPEASFFRAYKAFERGQRSGSFDLNQWHDQFMRNGGSSRPVRAAAGPAPAAAAPQFNQNPPVDTSRPMSAELQALTDLVGSDDADAIPETAAETVNQKYRMIRSKLKRVLTGRSVKNYFLLFGDPGIGKSTIVNEVLEHLGIMDETYYASGDIGASRTAVATFLFKNRNRPYIVLDDCDSMVMKSVNGAVSNMLKGALDKDRHTVTIAPAVAQAIKKFMSEEDVELGLGDMIGTDDDGNPIDNSMTNDGDVPTQFKWDVPKMVMISNANETNINDALLSRCDYYCLHLTQEEYLVRLAFVIKNLDFNKGIPEDKQAYTNEQYDAAKDIVYSMMCLAIEAANTGRSLAGVPIRLTHSLEFRLIQSLVDDWLRIYEDHLDDGEEGVELERAVKREFIRQCLAPKL